jgi:hypothetical protein
MAFFTLSEVLGAMTVPTHVAIIISASPLGMREAAHAEPAGWTGL